MFSRRGDNGTIRVPEYFSQQCLCRPLSRVPPSSHTPADPAPLEDPVWEAAFAFADADGLLEDLEEWATDEYVDSVAYAAMGDFVESVTEEDLGDQEYCARVWADWRQFEERVAAAHEASRRKLDRRLNAPTPAPSLRDAACAHVDIDTFAYWTGDEAARRVFELDPHRANDSWFGSADEHWRAFEESWARHTRDQRWTVYLNWSSRTEEEAERRTSAYFWSRHTPAQRWALDRILYPLPHRRHARVLGRRRSHAPIRPRVRARRTKRASTARAGPDSDDPEPGPSSGRPNIWPSLRDVVPGLTATSSTAPHALPGGRA
jgi:hypothetical protein